MGIVILSVAGIAIIIGLASANASASTGSRSQAPSVPPLGPAPSSSVPEEVAIVLDALRKGTATPDMVREAIAAAKEAGLTETVKILIQHLKRLESVTIPNIVRQPDRAPYPIPLDPATGKTLWFEENGSMRPRFRSVLVQFETLQEEVGTDTDGRIGPKTLAAFKSRLESQGLDPSKAPQTIEALAANAVKWTEILRGNIPQAQIGAVPWRRFVSVNNRDLQKLVPKVDEKLGDWVGRQALGQEISLSGLVGIVQRAGFRGAAQWLKSEKDKQRYPNTTKAFTETNGIF